MSFQHDARRTNWIFFTLYITICYILVMAAAVKAASCICPSCVQKDAVQRCACCVYRQYGKRSGQAADTFPGLDATFDKGPPVIAEGDSDWSFLDDDRGNNENELPRINQDSHTRDARLRSRSNSNPTPNSYYRNFFQRGLLNRSVLERNRLQGAVLTSPLVDVLEEIDPKTRDLKPSQLAQPNPAFNSYRFMPDVQGANSHNSFPLRYGLIKLVRGERSE